MPSRPELRAAVERLPLGPLHEAFGSADGYLVGGEVRDFLRGAGPGPDVDVAVDGDVEAVLASVDPTLGIEVEARHERFGTATVLVGGSRIDLSRTRTETYPTPGALPEVSAAPIERDLARRDFTVNAMAIPLGSPDELLDPFDGEADLRAGILRILHPRSFVDDPTRAIRAARYAARLRLDPDRETLEHLRATNLETVSPDRRMAEHARLAAEPDAADGYALLVEWGLLALSPKTLALIAAIGDRAAVPPWADDPRARAGAIQVAVEGGERAKRAMGLARAQPGRPSEAVRLAAPHGTADLLVAAAAGGEWVEPYLRDWRAMRLEIDGADLIAAGIPEGPAIGAALGGALDAKLDGELVGGREAELALALALGRAAI